jgi:hypothetical protein
MEKLKKENGKLVKDRLILQKYISSIIPKTSEGNILRKIIFCGALDKFSNKELKELILRYCPEENLNSEFMKI